MRLAILLLAVIVLGLLGLLIFQNDWLSGRGRVVVMSEPSGAQVWVDLKPTAVTTNGVLRNISSGKHSVMVRLDTLEADPLVHVVYVERGKTDTVKFLMKPPAYAARRVPPPSMSSTAPSADYPFQRPVAPEETPKSSPRAEAPRPAERAFVEPDTITRATKKTAADAVGGGFVEVASSLLGAKIFVNDKLRPDVTPTKFKLPPGTYTLRVEMDGHTPDPRDQTLVVGRSSPAQLVFFDLIASTTTRELTIETSPLAGKIYVDSVLVGEGSVTKSVEIGTHIVSFGPVDGYRTPDISRLSVTPDRLQYTAKGLYTRNITISAAAEGETSVTTSGGVTWSVGVYMDEEGAKPSAALGAKIRRIPDSQRFGWELAEGDPTRNPTGGDYIEFVFTLPDDVPPNSPLKLRLYLYRAARRYAYTLSGNSEIVVSINGHAFLNGYRPTYATDNADAGRYEEWPLSGTLREGENRLMVRSGNHNTLYNYLWKWEILP
jgi:hypothetical protein